MAVVAFPSILESAVAAAAPNQKEANSFRRTSSSSSSAQHAKGFAAFLHGGVAGCVAKTVTAPCTRLTVLAQTATLMTSVQLARPSGPGLGTISLLRDVISTDGVRALWKGNVLTCVHRFPYTGVNFGIVEFCWKRFPETFNGSSLAELVPGAISGSIAVIACYPLEVLRTRSMAQRSQSPGLLNSMARMLSQERPSSIYRGVGTSLGVTIPSMSISFATYRRLNNSLKNHPLFSPTTASFIAGGLSGVAGSVVTYPLDVLRKRLQMMGADPNIPERGAIAEATQIWRSEGRFGFWRGLTPELTKVFPSVAVTFCTFEWLRTHVL